MPPSTPLGRSPTSSQPPDDRTVTGPKLGRTALRRNYRRAAARSSPPRPPDIARATSGIMGRHTSRSRRWRPLLPHDHDQHWLPEPIPSSYYARGEAPAWIRWATMARGPTAVVRGWPPRTTLAVAAAAAGVLLIGLVLGLARHPTPAGDRTALASPPPGRSTPLAAAPTGTPTTTPLPTPTPRPTPTLTILTPRLQGRTGRSVTLQATTEPAIACTVVVGYSPPPQLGSVTSDARGAVSWTWSVSSQVQPGSYPIQVSCGGATAGATITVTGGGGGQG